MATHTQVKVKCLHCGLHYVICTWHPEKWKENIESGDVGCPECLMVGKYKLFWFEEVPEMICEVVPGKAELIGDFERMNIPIEKLKPREKGHGPVGGE